MLIDGTEYRLHDGHGALLLGHAHLRWLPPSEQVSRARTTRCPFARGRVAEQSFRCPLRREVRFTASGTERMLAAVAEQRRAGSLVKLQDHFHGWSDAVSPTSMPRATPNAGRRPRRARASDHRGPHDDPAARADSPWRCARDHGAVRRPLRPAAAARSFIARPDRCTATAPCSSSRVVTGFRIPRAACRRARDHPDISVLASHGGGLPSAPLPGSRTCSTARDDVAIPELQRQPAQRSRESRRCAWSPMEPSGTAEAYR